MRIENLKIISYFQNKTSSKIFLFLLKMLYQFITLTFVFILTFMYYIFVVTDGFFEDEIWGRLSGLTQLFWEETLFESESQPPPP